jgi:hypothetical protein
MTTTIASTKDTLQTLLRLHRAAVETYEVAARNMKTGHRAAALVELRAEHEIAASKIRNTLARLHDRGDVEGSGAIGTAVVTLERFAGWFGPAGSLRGLQLGEVALVGYLREVLEDHSLVGVAETLVREDLLPAAKQRAEGLGALIIPEEQRPGPDASAN